MPPPSRPGARRPWSQPLADLVAPCIAPAVNRFGFDEAALVLDWPAIVGERLASRCQPIRLQWPPRRGRAPEGPGEAATLIVRVDGAFAVELQHQLAVLIERINAHVGWRCVGKVALRQGPMLARKGRAGRVGPPDPAALQRALGATADITEEPLRDALARLGARVLHRRPT